MVLRAATLNARHDRLKAELSKDRQITWTYQDQHDVEEAELANIVNTQQLQFQQSILRRDLAEGQYQQKSMVLEEQLRGASFQLNAINRQLSLVTQEIAMTAGLLEKGYVSKTRMLELQRYQAGIEAQVAELTAQIDVFEGQLRTLEQDHQSQQVEWEQQRAAELATVEREWRDVFSR